jgi:hypothetical protein
MNTLPGKGALHSEDGFERIGRLTVKPCSTVYGRFASQAVALTLVTVRIE